MPIETIHVFHAGTHTSYSLDDWFEFDVEGPEGAFCYFKDTWHEVIDGIFKRIHPDGVPAEYRTMLLICA